MRSARGVGVLLAGLLGCLPPAVASPAAAAGVPDCSQVSGTDPAQHSHRRSVPLGVLDVAGAQRLASGGGARPGAGVTVAVLDSGIAPHGLIPVIASHSVGSATVRPNDYHGTAVAGLVAGASRPDGLETGIAPGARIVDVQVYGYSADASQAPTATTEDLVAGLRWLTAQARTLHVDIALVPLAVTPTPALASAVRALQRQGVLVVAPSGNRPADDGPGFLSAYYRDRPGQDGFADIGPADLPGVLVAGTTAAGSAPAVNPGSIPNHAVDVVVPSAEGVSLALNGGDCLLTTPATSWAAAEVAGVAALLVQRYAGESPARIAARIIDTASGTGRDGATGSGDGSSPEASLYLGAGVVQPVEALSRPLPGADHAFAALRAQPAPTPPVRPPAPRADLVHHSREVAVWAGLLAGAVVLVAAILRPLLSRGRSR